MQCMCVCIAVVCDTVYVVYNRNFPKLLLAEPLFDLASYINSPSLSDVELVSEDGS